MMPAEKPLPVSDVNVLICAALTASLKFLSRWVKDKEGISLTIEQMAYRVWPSLSNRERSGILNREINLQPQKLEQLIEQINREAKKLDVPVIATSHCIRRGMPLGGEPIQKTNASEEPTALALAMQTARAKQAESTAADTAATETESASSQDDAIVERRTNMKRVPINTATIERRRLGFGILQSEINSTLGMSATYYSGCLRTATAPLELLNLLQLTPEQASAPPPEEDPASTAATVADPPDHVLGIYEPAPAETNMPDHTPAPAAPASSANTLRFLPAEAVVPPLDDNAQMLTLLTSLEPDVAYALLQTKKELSLLPEGTQRLFKCVMSLLALFTPDQQSPARKLLGL